MAKKNNEVKQKNSYFKAMKQELKKVVWPTPKELVNNTIAVIVFVIIIGLIVFVLDFCFDNLNKHGITKLQEKIQSSFQTTQDSENANETNTTDVILDDDEDEDTETEDSDVSSDNAVDAQAVENNESNE